jgi:hypothetical protein
MTTTTDLRKIRIGTIGTKDVYLVYRDGKMVTITEERAR